MVSHPAARPRLGHLSVCAGLLTPSHGLPSWPQGSSGRIPPPPGQPWGREALFAFLHFNKRGLETKGLWVLPDWFFQRRGSVCSGGGGAPVVRSPPLVPPDSPLRGASDSRRSPFLSLPLVPPTPCHLPLQGFCNMLSRRYCCRFSSINPFELESYHNANSLWYYLRLCIIRTSPTRFPSKLNLLWKQ